MEYQDYYPANQYAGQRKPQKTKSHNFTSSKIKNHQKGEILMGNFRDFAGTHVVESSGERSRSGEDRGLEQNREIRDE